MKTQATFELTAVEVELLRTVAVKFGYKRVSPMLKETPVEKRAMVRFAIENTVRHALQVAMK